MGKFLNLFSWKYCDTFENVHFFAFTPIEKKWSSALLLHWMPPSKAPFAFGRSCVQFLPHDIMKHHDFSWKIQISDLRSGCNKFYSTLGSNPLDGCWPLTKSPLVPEGEVGKFLNLFSWKYCDTFENVHFFAFQTERKILFVCSFITMIAPFKSTLGNWEVMCSILPHDIMKHHDFCWKIRISDLRSGCIKFYSSLWAVIL